MTRPIAGRIIGARGPAGTKGIAGQDQGNCWPGPGRSPAGSRTGSRSGPRSLAVRVVRRAGDSADVTTPRIGQNVTTWRNVRFWTFPRKSSAPGSPRTNDLRPAGTKPRPMIWTVHNPLSRVNMMRHVPTTRTTSMIISSARFILPYPPFKLYEMEAKMRRSPAILDPAGSPRGSGAGPAARTIQGLRCSWNFPKKLPAGSISGSRPGPRCLIV